MQAKLPVATSNQPESPSPSDDRARRFVELLTGNQRRIFAYIRAQVRCVSDADDILQETSTILWQKFDQFDATASFARWACGIARREVLSHWRHEKRLYPLLSDELSAALSDSLLRAVDDFKPRQEALAGCLQELTSRQRDIIQQRYQSSTRVDQIAKGVGRSEKTVYRWLSQIHQLLFDCIERKLSQEVSR